MTSTPRPPIDSAPLPLQRNGLPTLPTWLLSLMLLPASLLLPFMLALSFGKITLSAAVTEGVSVLLLVALAAVLIITIKGGRGIIPLLVLVGFLLVQAGQSFLPAAVFIGLLFAIGEGALLVSVSSKETLTKLPLIPLIAYGLALLLCRDLLLAVSALLPFPAAVAMALGTRSAANKPDGLTRVGVICVSSLVLGASAAVAAAAVLYRAQGSLSLQTLGSLLDELRAAMENTLLENIRLVNEQVKDMAISTDPDDITNAVNGIINLLPAGLVILCNLTVALSQMVLHAALSCYGFSGSVRGKVRVFRMSLISSIVFLVAVIVSLVAVGAGNSSTLVGTVAENIFLILCPGLALCGLLRFLARLTHGGRRIGCLFIFLFLFVFILPYVFLIMPFYEAISAIFGAIFSRFRPKKPDDTNPSGKGGDDSDDSGNSL